VKGIRAAVNIYEVPWRQPGEAPAGGDPAPRAGAG
jgi:hypothetical protein